MAGLLEKAVKIRGTGPLALCSHSEHKLPMKLIWQETIELLRADKKIFDALRQEWENASKSSLDLPLAQSFAEYKKYASEGNQEISQVFQGAIKDDGRDATFRKLAGIVGDFYRKDVLYAHALKSPWYAIYLESFMVNVTNQYRVDTLNRAIETLAFLEHFDPRGERLLDLQLLRPPVDCLVKNDEWKFLRSVPEAVELARKMLEGLELDPEDELGGALIPAVLCRHLSPEGEELDPEYLLRTIFSGVHTVPVNEAAWQRVLAGLDILWKDAGRLSEEQLARAKELKVTVVGGEGENTTVEFSGAGLAKPIRVDFARKYRHNILVYCAGEKFPIKRLEQSVQKRWPGVHLSSGQMKTPNRVFEPRLPTDPTVDSLHWTRGRLSLKGRIRLTASCLHTLLTGQSRVLAALPRPGELAEFLQANFELSLPRFGADLQLLLMREQAQLAQAYNWEGIYYWPALGGLGQFDVRDWHAQLAFAQKMHGRFLGVAAPKGFKRATKKKQRNSSSSEESPRAKAVLTKTPTPPKPFKPAARPPSVEEAVPTISMASISAKTLKTEVRHFTPAKFAAGKNTLPLAPPAATSEA